MFMSFFDVKKGKCRGSKKESYLHAHNTNTDDVLICSQHLQQWLNYSETDSRTAGMTGEVQPLTFGDELKELILHNHK